MNPYAIFPYFFVVVSLLPFSFAFFDVDQVRSRLFAGQSGAPRPERTATANDRDPRALSLLLFCPLFWLHFLEKLEVLRSLRCSLLHFLLNICINSLLQLLLDKLSFNSLCLFGGNGANSSLGF